MIVALVMREVVAVKSFNFVVPFKITVSVAFIKFTVAVVEERLKKPELPDKKVFEMVVESADASTHFGATKTSIVPVPPPL